MEITTKPAGDIRSQAQSKLPEFLLAEYEHMCESLLRNEELGEKRAAFFVTLVGASGGILGFLFRENSPFLSYDQIFLAAAVVAAILLCLGFMTVRRLIERDIVTDKIKFTLRTLRRLFLTKTEAEAVPNAFFAPYAELESRSMKLLSIEKGGWLRTVAFVNAILTGVFVFAACFTREWAIAWPWQKVIALFLALAGGIVVWILQLNYAGSLITDNQKELRLAETP
jgi:hypothetical protein